MISVDSLGTSVQPQRTKNRSPQRSSTSAFKARPTLIADKSSNSATHLQAAESALHISKGRLQAPRVLERADYQALRGCLRPSTKENRYVGVAFSQPRAVRSYCCFVSGPFVVGLGTSLAGRSSSPVGAQLHANHVFAFRWKPRALESVIPGSRTGS